MSAIYHLIPVRLIAGVWMLLVYRAVGAWIQSRLPI